MDIADYSISPFTKFADDWALLTAGVPADFNSMTIAWGGLGTMWGKPVAFLVVKPSRYTAEFVKKYDTCTVSWYDKQYKKALTTFGTKSGRDIDKVQATNFTPKDIDGCVTYAEAKETLVLKKLFLQQLDRSLIPAECLKWYPEGTKEEQTHYLLIAEVLKIDA